MTPSAQGTPRADAAGTFVLTNSTLQPVPLVSEIRLHLAEDAFRVWEASERDGRDRREHDGREYDGGTRDGGHPELPPPFWAFAWPGGQALARHILYHPQLVAGRSVLDLGSGSGVTAIAAALAGASTVLASEVDPFARAAIALNAAANGAGIAVTGDVLAGDGENADVILAADVWYERELAARTLAMLGRAGQRGARVLVGDIGRAFLPRRSLREIAAFEVPVLADLEDASVKRVLILTLL
jgi:predicted nicotinamide N-methyase